MFTREIKPGKKAFYDSYRLFKKVTDLKKYMRPKKKKIHAACILCMLCLLLAGCKGSGAKSNAQGLEAYQLGEYEKAEVLFNQAITQEQRNSKYYENLGMTQYMLGNNTKALESFQIALELDPDSAKACRGKGLVLLAEENYDEAISWLDQAFSALEDTHTELAYDIAAYRAFAKEKANDYAGASEDYCFLIENGYEIEQMYLLLGNVYLKQNEPDIALDAFQESINLGYRDYEKYLNMLSYLRDSGYEELCEKVFNAALSFAPQTAKERYYRGLLYLEQENIQDAFSEFEQAYNEGCAEAGYCLGYCYEVKEDYKTAEQIYQKWLLEHPNDARAYNQMAVCKMKQEDYEGALTLIRQGQSLNDPDVKADLLWNEAVCYEKIKNYSKALELFEQYHLLCPFSQECMTEIAYLKSR